MSDPLSKPDAPSTEPVSGPENGQAADGSASLEAGVSATQPTVADATRATPPADTEPLPTQIFGDYELLVEVARGGMGVVYRARQVTLGRVVALKMILGGRLADDDDVLRFRTEAQAAARLQHPNIVTVHDVGEVDGHHYFTMEFIEGTSLAQRLAQSGPLPSKVAARYVRDVARAVHHAHRHGILHRDLKPSNIMVNADDEPHVTDFGLAKRLGAGDSGQTRTGAVLGTPSYMSPEQASGKSRELGPACDVYGLGAVLYELLTGEPPFRAESPMETLMLVLHNEPTPPTQLKPDIDPDLETICLKCLQKDAALRNGSAEELADDLNRYLTGEPISARSFNVLDRIARTLERSHHDVVFSTWSTMILVIAAIVFASHVVVQILILTGQARPVVMAAKAAQFIAIGYVFWRNRGSRLLPTSLAERELWSIWIGYLVSYAVGLWVTRALVAYNVVGPPENYIEGWQDLMLYPFSTVISGLAFFIMGSNYWGRLYAVGVVFFVAAALMPTHIEWAPIEFGALWTLTLLAIGLHLRRLGEKAEAEKTPTPTAGSRAPTVGLRS